MKKFTKTLVAVAVLAATASGVAEARIVNILDQQPYGSELVLNAINLTKDNSVLVDLGINVAQYLAQKDQDFSFTLNAAEFQQFTSLIAVGDNVTWGVYAGHRDSSVESSYPFVGLYTTSVEPVPAVVSGNFTQIDNSVGKVGDIALAVTEEFDNSNNFSEFRIAGEAGLTTYLANDLGGSLPFQAQAEIGTELTFLHEGWDYNVLADFDTTVVEYYGSFNLTLNNGVGTLAYTAPVPVPAAVWMFGAGLMGMLGLTRRKSVAA